MKISRHSLIFGLSYALDIAGKNNLSHSKSTAYLSVMIGRELGFDGNAVLSLYYAALLHDIGISNEYVMFEHCKIGADMLAKLPLPEAVPDYVLYHHEFYNGTGVFNLSGAQIPAGAQVIAFASAFDDYFGKKTEAFTRDLFLEIEKWTDTNRDCFSAEIVGAFEKLLKTEAFLLDYFNHETKYKISQRIVVSDETYYGYDDILKFAECFADIIDRRSPFTFTHSRGIAQLARKAAVTLGYDGAVRDKMYIAGLLHDIGKLHVPVEILHKNGKLTPEERFEINKHTYYTRKILEQIEGFEEITNWAANHHERMDGTGYPYRISGGALGELERAMAVCDVYQALTEERPYRTPLPADEVWRIIDGMADGGHLDGDVVKKLKQQ